MTASFDLLRLLPFIEIMTAWFIGMPDRTVRRIYGVFDGTITVNRQAICTLPL